MTATTNPATNPPVNPTTITAAPGTPFLDVEREFDAPPAQVFAAHTDPDLVAQWLGPCDLKIRIEDWEARTGGEYRYVHYRDGGFEAHFRGVFHTVRDRELIVQTFEFEGAPDHVCVETLHFDDLDGRTRLRTHSVFPSVEARDAAVEAGMNSGITESMDRLAELLAG
jgi:uncharacterized protein YndB with AHSA1/START domain